MAERDSPRGQPQERLAPPRCLAHSRVMGTELVSEICTYCTMPTDEPEEEHTCPRSWYPEGVTPSQMLVVPSCPDCNDRYSRIEERVRGRLGVALSGATDTEARGVGDRVLRSISSAHGTSKRDAEHREGRRQRLLQHMSIASPSEWGRALPSTALPEHPQWLQDPQSQLWKFGLPQVRFDPADLEAMTVKFVRGVYRALHKTVLPVAIPVATPIMTEQPMRALESIVKAEGMTMHGAPGFRVWHGHQGGEREDRLTTMTLVLLWGRIVLSGFTGAAATPRPPTR